MANSIFCYTWVLICTSYIHIYTYPYIDSLDGSSSLTSDATNTVAPRGCLHSRAEGPAAMSTGVHGLAASATMAVTAGAYSAIL